MNPDARCLWAAIEELADLVVSELLDNPKLHGEPFLGRYAVQRLGESYSIGAGHSRVVTRC